MMRFFGLKKKKKKEKSKDLNKLILFIREGKKNNRGWSLG